ncbi:hypothetical protein [Lyngbya sp. CCY1209]|uniref:hypothetical protein n=1 Tax=Lyngbya sp. CCY1209 TaxID=2886103 RepID=UPI002D2030D1|nr:hypothetical protein [Lyngbya sp. CCY1209]MEB3884978.1 hypothetical protein [Lyngbya sp. CCY1209]
MSKLTSSSVLDICDIDFNEELSNPNRVQGGVYATTDSFAWAYTDVALAGANAIAVGDYTATTANAYTSVYNEDNFSESFASSNATALAISGDSQASSFSDDWAIFGSFSN